MDTILSNYTASISELKASPTKLLARAGGNAVAILNHNTPSAYLVPADRYEQLLNMADDYLLSQQVGDRLSDGSTPIKVSLDAL
ncbi:type II toxin-antitoxin system Phd/YefM family antitoxin [Candidatus Spongiihabitans sp.]|uniref:type II toxin-antitoxin system Phd/YefM family antitoxin n=1 Tax=Candidatus Spongiihabitans sp. TaxID=3101308 RepID=UPI003C7E6510